MERGPELFRLTVYGQPAGAGSKTAEVVCRGRRGEPKVPVRDERGNFILRYRHATKGTEEWMATVEKEAGIGWGQGDPIEGPVWIEIDCFEARPDAHFRADGTLRPDAPAHPSRTITHDSGKMRRAIEDAITNATVWADDKRVVDGHDRKHYCDREAVVFEKELEGDRWREPRAVIRIGRMAAATVADAGITSPPAAGQVQLLAA
jgi:Holliday junction resolvase RusA-like endonuclease